MTTSHRRSTRSILVVAFAASLGLGACSTASGPATVPSSSAPFASLPASDLPTDGTGGGASGEPGTGLGGTPADPTPADPAAGQPALVTPVPGRVDPHPVVPTALQASVDGRRVLVKVTWYGGVEPCSVLDSVVVKRDGNDISITPVEGSSDKDAICIEIAMLKATIVDLGELEPGTYRIASPGSDIAPIEITIS